MKKNIALMVLVLFVMGNVAFAANTVKTSTTEKAKTKVVKMEKKAAKADVKTAAKKPAKKSLISRGWNKMTGWMHKKSTSEATAAPKVKKTK
jgi:hypothetical protein